LPPMRVIDVNNIINKQELLFISVTKSYVLYFLFGA
jgi:hypothetical protein